MKKKLLALTIGLMAIFVAACDSEADVVSKNISKSSDSFDV
ncbi:hypothetical protein [Bacillus phage SDFMU_Pbc]|uniref:Lipoprotein n=1 Tax=Bacillus phage SDFMU_Pbc TaxID=3076135 RepID=A0AA96QYA1_9CAUD|nr:hypothetical protein [Bacillus phage SDFMU_Pbc]